MQNFNFIELLAKLGVEYVPFLFALCFHEFAHGYVAKKRGDNTAELMGRLTLNPFAHADVIGTFVLPIAGIMAGVGGMNAGHGFIFGWAKPVPVNSRNLRKPKNDMPWIAAAGPLSNLILAFVSIILFILLGFFLKDIVAYEALRTVLRNFVVLNVLLCVFNLIPLHPLDGGKILERFIPSDWNRWIEDNQMTLNIALIVFFVMGGFSVLQGPMFFLIGSLEKLALLILSPFI
jgi:Zn-dependent protease